MIKSIISESNSISLVAVADEVRRRFSIFWSRHSEMAVCELTAHLLRAKQFAAPGQERMVKDAEHRLNILLGLMNCDDLQVNTQLLLASLLGI
ncbi:hypothetical protein GGF42_000248 [Coemansia sp. RSA 2424]|nr:hypothetical protein GGF42_000248 [Coemansia sp. RSA 2424]